MKNFVLLCFAAVALAAAAFFVLSGDDGSSSGPAAVGLTEGTPDSGVASGPSEPAELGDLEAGPKQGGREVATTLAPIAPARRSDSAASENRTEAGGGQGTLSGRITDRNGAPLAGAVITVARSDFEDLFASATRQNALSKVPTAKSDKTGRFSLMADAGGVRVSVLAEGFAPYSSTVTVSRDQENDLGDLSLPEGVTLIGRVVDSDGSGIAGAELVREAEALDGLVVLGGPKDVVATTDATGRFSVREQAVGPYKFFVNHSAYPSGELQGKTERSGETVSGLEVVLQNGVRVMGVVMGLPGDSTEYSVTADVGSPGDRAFTFGSGPGTKRTGRVQASGSFEIGGLRPNTDYYLIVTKGTSSLWGSGARRSQAVSVKTPSEGVGPAVQIAYSTGATLRFTVTGTDGVSLSPDQIEAGFGFSRQWPDAQTDDDAGAFVLHGLWPAQGGEELSLRLTAKGYDPWEAESLVLYPDDDVDLGVIRLVPRSAVRVTVLDDATGEPVVGARVTLAPPKKRGGSISINMRSSWTGDDEPETETVFGNREIQSGETDAEGVVTLDASAGSKVEIRVNDGVRAPMTVGPIDLPLTMTVFEQEVRLAMGGGVRVTVLDPSGAPVEGYSIEFKDEDFERAAQRSERTGSDGVFSLGGLAPGVHHLRLGKRGGSGAMIVVPSLSGVLGQKTEDDSWTAVNVVPGEFVPVTLTAPAICSLAGSVKELGQALGGARVKLRKAGGDDSLAGIMMLGGSASNSATADALGKFQIEDVEAGEYELVVEHGMRAMPYVEEITIEDANEEVHLDLSVTEVTGTVLDENGDPVPGARLKAEPAPKAGGSGLSRVSMVMMSDSGGGAVMMSSGPEEATPTTTDEEGRYRLRGVAAGVRLQIKADADGYDTVTSEPFEVAEGSSESGVDLRFELSGSIRIEVEGLSGRAMAMIRRDQAVASEQPKIQMLSGSSTTVDALAPGSWTVRLQGIGGQALKVDPSTVKIEVSGGETAVAAFKVM